MGNNTIIDELNILEMEGINITKRSQKDDCIFDKDYNDKTHLEKVCRDYNLWCEKIKDLIKEYQIDSDLTGFFFESDTVPKLIGLYQFRIDKEKSRKLLENIQSETKKKLEYLRKLKSELTVKLKRNSLKSIHLISESVVAKDKIFLVLDRHFETPIRFRTKNNKGADTAIKELHNIAYSVNAPGKKVDYNERIADNINNGLFKKKLITKYMKTNKLEKPTLVKKSEDEILVLGGEVLIKIGLIKYDVPSELQYLYIDKTQ